MACRRHHQQPNQLPTQPSGTDPDNPDRRQQQPPNRRRRPHSSDTDPDDSDFEPNSDVTEMTAKQQNELDRITEGKWVLVTFLCRWQFFMSKNDINNSTPLHLRWGGSF